MAILTSCSGTAGTDGDDPSSTAESEFSLDVTHDSSLHVDIDPMVDSADPQRGFTLRALGATEEWGFEVSADQPWVMLDRNGASGVSLQSSATVSVTIDRAALVAAGSGNYAASLTFTPQMGSSSSSTVRRLTVQVGDVAPSQGRVTDRLVSLYEFGETSGTTVHDTSGIGVPADLEIETPDEIQRRPGALWLDGFSRIASSGPATKIIDACVASNEITIEAWISPAAAEQSGPARIVSVSGGSVERNVTLGHGLWGSLPDTAYNVRLRTDDPSTDANGSPDVRTGEGVASAALQHVVYVRSSDGTSQIYVDGVLEVTDSVPGTFANWDSGFRLALGNEIGDSRPWYGGFHLVAVYDKALSSAEVEQNYRAGSGDPLVGFLVVSPAMDFATIGPVAGTLSSESKDYVVANNGTERIDWAVELSEDWVVVDGSSEGALDPGETATVTVRIDTAQTGAFEVGDYVARIAFVNRTNAFGSATYAARLTYYEPGSGSGERPGPHNTGPTFPGALTPSGSITATQDGQIIENVDVTGRITIRANNVTIRNFRINAEYGTYGINVGFDHSGTVIEDGEIRNVASACIFGRGFTARRLNLHESRGDGIKAQGNTLVEGCWIHHLGNSPGAHADGNQTRGGDNLVFRGNNFDMPIPESANGTQGYKSNAALIIQDSLATIDDFLIEGNWLNGGNATVFVTPNNPGGITRLRILNNRFGRDFRYSLIRTGGNPAIISGNVWDDTGEPIDDNNQ